MYTLLMVDPDVASATAGTADNPLLHWMVMNIPNGVTEQDDTVHEYWGPKPPGYMVHTYYYLLYEQTVRLNTETDANYASASCVDRLLGR
jgi:phosphatidylethanolamine-binding protein (PEBP) family uncharacterized protein